LELNTSIPDIIINQLLWNPKFFGKVIPFIIIDYFENTTHKTIITLIIKYFNDYNSQIPDPNVLKVMVEEESLNETSYSEVLQYIDAVCLSSFSTDDEWLLANSEKFCRERSIYNAIFRSISVLEGHDKTLSEDGLPELLEDALGVSFDIDIGHEYIENAKERYDFLHDHNAKYPCSLKAINKITNGGFEKKTLNVLIGSVGAGKSIMLAQLAKDYIENGKDVLFISLEMSEKNIGTRIDANSMHININKLDQLSESVYMSNIQKLKQKSYGKLIIKEYTPGSAHAGHFDALIKELKIKKGFIPDVILIDYIGICASKTVTPAVGLYSYGKAVTEELRALMIKHDVVGFSVVQFNRGAAFSSDANHSGIADSAAIIHTVDFLAGLLITEDLKARKRVILLQMKNRYGPDDVFRKQLLGLDTSLMRYYDVDPEEKIDGNDVDNIPLSDGDTTLFDESTNSATLPIGSGKNYKKNQNYGDIAI